MHMHINNMASHKHWWEVMIVCVQRKGKKIAARILNSYGKWIIYRGRGSHCSLCSWSHFLPHFFQTSPLQLTSCGDDGRRYPYAPILLLAPRTGLGRNPGLHFPTTFVLSWRTGAAPSSSSSSPVLLPAARTTHTERRDRGGSDSSWRLLHFLRVHSCPADSGDDCMTHGGLCSSSSCSFNQHFPSDGQTAFLIPIISFSPGRDPL